MCVLLCSRSVVFRVFMCCVIVVSFLLWCNVYLIVFRSCCCLYLCCVHVCVCVPVMLLCVWFVVFSLFDIVGVYLCVCFRLVVRIGCVFVFMRVCSRCCLLCWLMWCSRIVVTNCVHEIVLYLHCLRLSVLRVSCMCCMFSIVRACLLVVV